MEKHIVVEDCTECPHYEIFIPPKDLPARSICGKHRMGKLGFENYNGPIKIPDWCPLDDVPENAAHNSRGG